MDQWKNSGWQILDEALGSLGADNVILWLDEGDSDSLKSVYATLGDEFIGFRQSLSKGLISQVFLSGMPLLEKDLKARNEHDPSMDEHTGVRCQSMIVAPVTWGDEIVGVLSGVRFESERLVEPFELDQLNELAIISKKLMDDFEIEGCDEATNS